MRVWQWMACLGVGGSAVAGMALPAAVSGQGLGADDGAVQLAMAEVRDHGWSPRVVRTRDAVVYPFGHADAEVVCAPLHACFLALQDGEDVTGVARGDAVRWKVDTIGQGGDRRRTLVVIKPIACDISTNLVLATDRRVYDVALRSPPCAGKAGTGSAPADRHVAFYYPDDYVVGRPDSARRDSAAVPASASARSAPADRLTFGYRWHATKPVPWAPEAVYDDSAHVYVRLPDAVRHLAAPALWELLPDGSRAVINYVVRDGVYKTDRVVNRAVLSLGTGKNERTVEIDSPRYRDEQASR